MAPNGLLCADVPLRTYTLTAPPTPGRCKRRTKPGLRAGFSVCLSVLCASFYMVFGVLVSACEAVLTHSTGSVFVLAFIHHGGSTEQSTQIEYYRRGKNRQTDRQ